MSTECEGIQSLARSRATPIFCRVRILRHAAASKLIADGLDDALVADQPGHENSTITPKVYAYAYDRAAKAQAVREAFAEGPSPKAR